MENIYIFREDKRVKVLEKLLIGDELLEVCTTV